MPQLPDALRVAESIVVALRDLYKQGENDYSLPPIVVNGPSFGRVSANDAVIFCCKRGERELQLTRAFVDNDFHEFPCERIVPLTFVPFTLYHQSLKHLPSVFAPARIQDTLGEVVSQHGMHQFRLAEAEKFAHVTYFFDGARSIEFSGVSSVSVPSNLSDPALALAATLDALEEHLSNQQPELVVMNLAMGDLVGHATHLSPKIRCAEALDDALDEVMQLAKRHKYWIAITADHGLLEDHGLPNGPPNHSHTSNRVPFLLRGPDGPQLRLRSPGTLADVAPTLLEGLSIPAPASMSGSSLLLEPKMMEKIVLVILDGWGLSHPDHVSPIELAETPHWDDFYGGNMAELEASGEAVGLPVGRKGNSEAGHMNLGAGRIVSQDDSRIETAIASGKIRSNQVLNRAMASVKNQGSALHLIGLLSKTSSHGSIDYVLEMIRMARARELDEVFIHLITDGRSTSPVSAPTLVTEFSNDLKNIGVGNIATLVGRGLALDRGGKYKDKTQLAYQAMVAGEGIIVDRYS